MKHGIYIIPRKHWNTKQIWVNNYLVMTYPRVPKRIQFQHAMVNDENQNLCGGWHLDWEDENDKILSRVADGLKPLGIAHAIESRAEVEQLVRQLEADGLDVKVTPSPVRGWDIAVAHPGTLGEVFDLSTLAEDYVASGGISSDQMAREIAQYTHRSLISFAGKYDVDAVPPWVTGLILGYPVENTISLYLRGF